MALLTGFGDGPFRPRSLWNTELTKMIHEINADFRGSYGWPRVHAEFILGLGGPGNYQRVERLVREAGLQAGTVVQSEDSAGDR